MNEVIKILEEHSNNFVAINSKLEEHDQIFVSISNRFDEIDKKFDHVDKRFEQVDKRLDLLTLKVIEHDERFDRIEANMATKDDIRGINNTLDKLVKLVERKDQETTVISHDLHGVENRVEVLEKDMIVMKPVLGLS